MHPKINLLKIKSLFYILDLDSIYFLTCSTFISASIATFVAYLSATDSTFSSTENSHALKKSYAILKYPPSLL